MVETLSQTKPSKNYAIENKIVSINQANLTRSYQECIKDGKNRCVSFPKYKKQH